MQDRSCTVIRLDERVRGSAGLEKFNYQLLSPKTILYKDRTWRSQDLVAQHIPMAGAYTPSTIQYAYPHELIPRTGQCLAFRPLKFSCQLQGGASKCQACQPQGG
ncbi:unnamed protein product [Eretmochelys imbricata]